MLGEVVGSYRITGQIGAGGMGAVYEAEHLLLGRRAAVKVLLPDRCTDKETVERFFNEARATTRIQHPGIVKIFDYGHLESGNAFIVMELLEGESLGTRLKREGRFSSTQAIAIARHIAGLLGEAHRHGVIHRDLKPDNVFLVPDPALPRGERAKVLDFGIAKLADDEEGGGLQTKTGTLMGTPVYMSPEQCRGAGGVDHRSDIYALGCVLYQMLCGRPPFVAEGSGEIIAAHIHVEPSPVRVYEASVPPDLEAVVMKLLQKDVALRYQTMEQVIEALNGAVPFSVGVPEPSLAASGHFAAAQTEPDLAKVPADFDVGTTLASHARQSQEQTAVTAPKAPAMSLAAKVLLGVGALGVAAGVALLLRGGNEKAAVVAAPVQADAQVAPVIAPKPFVEAPVERPVVERPVVERPVVERLKAATTVVLTIVSEPPGARIYRQSDGVRLGETPLDVTVRKGKGMAAFYLKKSGYSRASLEVATTDDAQVMTVLERRGSRGASSDDSKPFSEKPVDDTPVPEKPVDDAPVPEKPVDDTPEPGRNDAIDPFAKPSQSGAL
jgi:serine/threonine-protein kinase